MVLVSSGWLRVEKVKVRLPECPVCSAQTGGEGEAVLSIVSRDSVTQRQAE